MARREQIYVRVGISLIIGICFYSITDLAATITWVTGYIAFQLAEYVLFRPITAVTPLTPLKQIAGLAVMTTSNIGFASYGLLESSHGGTAGLVCACLLWSGAILNGAIVSGESKTVLACSIVPPLLHFFSVPYFVIENGGTLGSGLAIVLGGMLNGVGAISIWATSRRLMDNAAREREISRLALLDAESGLPSRHAVLSRVAELRKVSGDEIVVVAAIAIDRFVHLRGAIGHALMIELVIGLADRLAKIYPDAPFARLSNGVLGLAFTARDIDEAKSVTCRLQRAMTEPVQLRDNKVDVSVTIGLSVPDDAIASPAEVSILDRAMIAVDQARSARQSVALFDGRAYGSPGSNLSLMSEMLRAFDNGQMSVHYQPKISLRSNHIVGVEALVRWAHPERGALRPDLFVRMAEETGHIGALTEWVLRRALDDQRTLHRAGHDLCMSVNWSALVINDVQITDMALKLVEKAAGDVCLEITETAIIGNPDLARQTLDRLRAAGIKISIDDYGAGLSSLAYLKNIPADELKIDRAFVMNMANDPVDAVLVRSAVSLAHSLGLRSVAEGVENKGTLELLYAMGCDLAQGYGITMPMPLGELMTYLGRRQRKAG